MAENEVVIHVRSKNETKGGFEQAAKDAQKAGDQSGKSFLSRFGSWLMPSKMTLITSGIVSGLAALPALTGALGALAGIALGAKLLIGSKNSQGPLYASWEGFLHNLTSTFQREATPLIAPLKQAFASLGAFVRQEAPNIRAIFSALGQFVMPLTHAFEGLVGGVLPGFLALMRAARPAVSALSSLLSGLGRDLGAMFSAFAPAIKASADVLKMLGSIVNGLLPTIGKLAASLATSLGPVLKAFGQALHALMPALLTVGKVLGELAGAVLKSLSGALTAVAQLLKDIAPSLGILASALGKIFTAMENAGTFGILEDALEKLAGPLANLINALVKSLVPVLPQVIDGFVKFAAVLSSGIAQVLADVANAIASLVNKFPFLVPLILGVVAAVKAWSIAQAALDVLLSANPIGLIVIGIAALIAIIVELVKHWHEVAHVFDVVRHEIAHVLDDIRHDFARWADDLRHLVAHAFDDIRHDIASIFDDIRHDIAAKIDAILHDVLSWLDNLRHWISSKFDQIRHDIAAWGDNVVSWFKSLPGRILATLANLPSMMFRIGVNILEGLLHGLESMGSTVLGWAENFGSSILSKLGGALGIGSPSKKTYQHGVWLAQGLANGWRDGLAKYPLAGVPLGGIGARGGAVAASGPLQFEVLPGGSSAFEQFMVLAFRNWVRLKGGGNVQRAFGVPGAA